MVEIAGPVARSRAPSSAAGVQRRQQRRLRVALRRLAPEALDQRRDVLAPRAQRRQHHRARPTAATSSAGIEPAFGREVAERLGARAHERDVVLARASAAGRRAPSARPSNTGRSPRSRACRRALPRAARADWRRAARRWRARRTACRGVCSARAAMSCPVPGSPRIRIGPARGEQLLERALRSRTARARAERRERDAARLLRRRHLERARDRRQELRQADRLFEEIERADPGRLDGGLDRAVAGHHHHRHRQLRRPPPIRAAASRRRCRASRCRAAPAPAAAAAGTRAPRSRSRRAPRDSPRPAGSPTAARGCRLRRRRSGFPLPAPCVYLMCLRFAQAGMPTCTRAPCGATLSSSTRPPCSSTIFFTIASPSPVPFALVVTYGSNACASTYSANPGPRSANRERSPRRRARQRDRRMRGSVDVGLRVDRILEQIVEHLAQAGGLALDGSGASGKRQRDVRAQIVVQARARRARARQIDRLHLPGPRLARIDREVVDHVLHRRHLRDDRLRAALQRFLVGAVELRRELDCEALGGELDRRQRILDLVREPARHFGPRGVALRLRPARTHRRTPRRSRRTGVTGKPRCRAAAACA